MKRRSLQIVTFEGDTQQRGGRSTALFQWLSYKAVQSSIIAACFVLGGSWAAASVTNSPTGPAWKAALSTHPAVPKRLIAVDKDKQRLLVYDKDKKTLALSQSYNCTTGRKVGDKQVQGDLKTPEGVYFVVQHLTSGLDFTLYGNEAYTLNYPNPVDKLRKKTGYGIWIHGRGEAIRPLITQGCVAMNNEDLQTLGPLLTPGTPVALTSTVASIHSPSSADVATANDLRKHVEGWAKAWSSRSNSMFDYYDQQAYSIAQSEDFSKFRGQKERLFKSLPWIKTTVRDIQVLEGPGYWVTWFYQDYDAPNLTTKGVRRLYWHKDDKGKFVIIGMEWMPGLTSGSMLADAEEATPPIDAVPKSEEQAVPLEQSVSDTATLAAAEPNDRKDVVLQFDHVEDTGAEDFAIPAYALALVEKNQLDLVHAAVIGAPVESEPASSSKPTEGTKSGLHASATHAGFPEVDLSSLPPPLPAQGLTAGVEVAAPIQQAEDLEVSLVAVSSTPSSTPAVPAVEETGQAASVAQAPEEPIVETPKTEEPVADADPVLVASAKKPAHEEFIATEPEYAQPVDTTEATSSQPKMPAQAVAGLTEEEVRLMHETIEEWREAWQEGNLDLYVQFYTNHSTQGGRKGATSIKRHKEGLWARSAPASVKLQDIAIRMDGETVVTTMRQVYKDKQGKGDVGIKTIRWERGTDLWYIVQEDWSAVE